MKKFKLWIIEDGPTNISAGTGVRGLGDVSGQPGGSISNYAAANAAEAESIARSLTTNGAEGALNYSGGDTQDQILGKKTTKRMKNS